MAASLPGGTFPRQASFHAFTARSRVLLIHMAEAWMRLAHQAEKNLTTVYETPHRVLAPVLQERPQQVQPKTNATWSPTVEGLNPQTWPAQIVQRQFAKLVGIAHACAGKLDNLVGYSFRDGIDFIHSEGCACPFEGDPHGPLSFGIKSQAVQEFGDGHDAFTFYRRHYVVGSIHHAVVLLGRLLRTNDLSIRLN